MTCHYRGVPINDLITNLRPGPDNCVFFEVKLFIIQDVHKPPLECLGPTQDPQLRTENVQELIMCVPD